MLKRINTIMNSKKERKIFYPINLIVLFLLSSMTVFAYQAESTIEENEFAKYGYIEETYITTDDLRISEISGFFLVMQMRYL